jgi:hypothetical protein
MEFQKAKVLSLRDHPELSERWLQERISEDPSLLGLGDLVVKDIERRQPHAGRLDLLLHDPESGTRYEVEIQLGATNETHIIRTIEYWDTEKRRYPMYDHIGVLVAEDVTSRFLNVIGLFNGFIPLIAIQLQALEIGGVLTLATSRVVDIMTLGTDEEDDAGAAVDRSYWQTKAPAAIGLTDQLLALIQEVDPRVTLKYNKYYVGLAREGVPDNYLTFHPRKAQHVIVRFRIARSDELTERLEQSGMELMEYQVRSGQYGLRVTASDLADRRPLLMELIRRAHGSEGERPPAAKDE